MRITILGCGSSVGVPVLGNEWGQCDPSEPKNRRRRCSILIENRGFVLLVDTSPDLREQLLDADVKRIDAVLFTHSHADHTHGLDDLRPMFWRMGQPIDVYGDRRTLERLGNRFGYMFEKTDISPSYFRVPLEAHEITLNSINLGGMTIQPVLQNHGVSGDSLGFIFDQKFAYSTDVAHMTDFELSQLIGIDVWVVDCLRERESQAHSHLGRTLAWIKKVKPTRAYFTHMTSDIDYVTMLAKLPKGIEPAYDGLVIEI